MIEEAIQTITGPWLPAITTLAAIASASFAGWQIMQTRATSMHNAVSGLSCHFFTQAQLLPDGFEPVEPGAWSDEQVAFRLDNVSDYPFTSVTAVLDLVEHQLRGYVDWVPPRSTLYCVAGLADEHSFMHLDGVAGISLTFIDSTGKCWHRSPEGRLSRRRHALRRLEWTVWKHVPSSIRTGLPTSIRPRAIGGKVNFGATLAGIGQRIDANSSEWLEWAVFQPSRDMIDQDSRSVPQQTYLGIEDDWIQPKTEER
ncbi:hypothetical protein [Brevibacterium casei]|uniref:hypothetical protein n=1 Tax=Brevibacterium casei TaxID=33889 RepID=UPI0036F7D94F